MKKTLTNILIGTSLIGSLSFNSCNYEKPSTEIIKEIQISQEDTLLKTAGNFYYKRDYALAKENYSKFLEIKKNKNDSLGIAKGFQGLGLIFDSQGNYNEAVKYNLNALKIYENLKDSFRIAQISNNLGAISDAQGKYDKAFDYYAKSLNIQKNLNDSLEISKTLNNIGTIFDKQNKAEQALIYYFTSLKIADKIKDKAQEALCYGNIAGTYGKKEDLDKAFEYYQKSLIINKEIEDKEGIASNLINLGDIYRKKNNSFQALKNLENSLNIAKEINSPDLLKTIYQTFSETYEAQGKPDSALKYFKLFSQTKDTLFNKESSKQINELTIGYETEKKEIENVLLRKDNQIIEEKNEKQKYTIWGALGIAGLLLGGGAYFYRENKIKKKKNIILKKQKKEITDSIRYASNIQGSVLLGEQDVKKILGEDSFILFRPKDIVSGDFYWLAEKNGKKYFSASDCTGHGVPGAFMHMTINAFLNSAINEKKIEKPNEIFDDVRNEIINSFKSAGEAGAEQVHGGQIISPSHRVSLGAQKDGMDSILCSWDEKNNTLEFACANNPLYLIRNNKLEEIPADKMCVGYEDEIKPFKYNKIELQKNDLIYILSDGYKSQIGGPHNKRFMKKKLKEMLLENHAQPMQEQKNILNKSLNDWMAYINPEDGKSYEQTDDICVIGLRVRGSD